MGSKRLITLLIVLLQNLAPFGSWAQVTDTSTSVSMVGDSMDLSLADSSLSALDSSVLDLLDSSILSFGEPQPEREEALLRKKRTETWVLFVVIFIMILIGVMRALDSNRYYYSLRTPFRSYRSEQGFNDLIPGIDLFQSGLILIYSLVLGFALYIYHPFGLSPNLDSGWRNFLVLVIGIGVLYTLKYALYYLIFQILQSERLPSMIVISMSNLAFVFALVALPALLIVYYSLNDILRLYLGNALVIMSLIFVSYRFFRIIFITWPGFTLGRVYVILYLCTLEILPLLILARWAGLLG